MDAIAHICADIRDRIDTPTVIVSDWPVVSVRRPNLDFMNSGELSSFRDIAIALQAAVDNLNGAVESGDGTDVAYSNLLGALIDAAMASVDALGRFSPFTEPGFFSETPPDFTEVVGAGLDLPGDMVISRELVEDLAQVEERHRDNPAHREIGKAVASGALAMRAVMKLERELIALRNEVRGN